MPKMQKKRSNVARRAWNLLRLVLLSRRRLMMDLRLFHKFVKTLTHSSNRGAIHYGERELSFEKTPIIHIKMHRPSSMRFKIPKIPCLNTHDGFDYEDDWNYNESPRISYCNNDVVECEIEDGDEAIDVKAEEFIANFYKNLKLQRQISYLQYNETPGRGTC